MSSLKQKSVQCYASIPESRYTRPPAAGPLPFRSRHATNQSGNQPQEHHVNWQDKDASLRSIQSTATRSSSNNGTVKSWLLSTSPTSVIEQAQGERDPPTPSPICSPVPSSPVLSPRPPLTKPKSEEPSSELVPAKVGRTADGSISGRKFRKNIALQNVDAPPDSPTGSSGSSVSEGGLLALLASKLFSYKDHSRSSSRYSRERSGPIDDKHVVEDRSSKPPVEEFHLENPPPEDAQPSNSPVHRTTSGAASELSFGSANDRTLSMEFDAILAAAVAAGVTSALGTEGHSAVSAEESVQREDSPGVQEDSSLRCAHRDNPIDSGSRGRSYEGREAEIGSAALVAPFALAAAQRGGDGEDSSTATVTEMPLSSQSSSRGSRRIASEQTDNDSLSLPSSSNNSSRGSALGLYSDAGNSAGSENAFNRNSLALALEDDSSHDASSLVSPSSEGSSKENIAPNSGRQTLERVRRDKILAQVVAFQNAKNSKYDNRYKREEAKINAWENQQRIKAAVAMKKAEMKLEEKRARALEKMQNDIASAHKRAEERKASAEAVRGIKAAKVAVLTDNMRQMGKVSGGCFRS